MSLNVINRARPDTGGRRPKDAYNHPRVKLAVPKESRAGERRVAVTPENIARFVKMGFSVAVESGAGLAASFGDDDYAAAGAEVIADTRALWQAGDIVLKVQPPDAHPGLGVHEVDLLRDGATLISFLYPVKNKDLVDRLASRPVNVIAMDQIPRISRAQKMDALSSMANIAGYRAVIEAAEHFGRFIPGQMTAAGKVAPAQVFIVGIYAALARETPQQVLDRFGGKLFSEFKKALADVAVAALSPMSEQVRRLTADASEDALGLVGALAARTFTNPWTVESMRWELTHTAVSRLFTIADDAGLIGYCLCWVVAGELHINSLAVALPERRQGTGARFMREVMRRALELSSSNLILLHNHPSGDPTPSAADVQVTRMLREAARAIDIPLVDHVIVGQPGADPAGISRSRRPSAGRSRSAPARPESRRRHPWHPGRWRRRRGRSRRGPATVRG